MLDWCFKDTALIRDCAVGMPCKCPQLQLELMLVLMCSFPYLPPHVTKPKEVKKLYVVALPDKCYFAVSTGRTVHLQRPNC